MTAAVSPPAVTRRAVAPRCERCGKAWPRDPVLEVACPICGAEVGRPCRVIRPSEHVHSAAFAGLPPWGHDARDLLAAAENKYACGCGISPAIAKLEHAVREAVRR